jgi:hypothetical protein
MFFCSWTYFFSGTEGVGSPFHILRARTHFRRYRGHLISFSYFAIPGTFSVIRRASCLDFMFCAPGLIFSGIEGVGSRFHVLCSQIHFRRYRVCRVPFSCFARPESFSTVARALGVPFACFALPDSFSAVSSASASVFMFYEPRLIFGDTEAIRSHLHVFCSRTCFRRCRVRRVPFSYFVRLGLVFCGTEGVGSRFHVLRSRTHFRRYGGRRVPFSCFARADSFSAVPRASGPVFIFCAPELIFSGAECVGSYFSCFARPDSFSAIHRASDLVFMFFSPEHVLG